MTKSRLPTRQQQPATSGLGRAFSSPIKRRDKLKSTRAFQPYAQLARRNLLEARLEQLMEEMPLPQINSVQDNKPSIPALAQDSVMDDAADSTLPMMDILDTELDFKPSKRRTVPDQTTHDLFKRWREIVPRLVDPLLAYVESSVGEHVEAAVQSMSWCDKQGSCISKAISVLCLFFDHFQRLEVFGCECHDAQEVLIRHGLFPTSPMYPRTAFSIPLLDFYHALFERSCDAVNAMAAALNTFYARRGFLLLNKKGTPIQDPFRRGLGHALQWYDKVQVLIEERVECAIKNADKQTQSLNLSPTECARILQQRCPACFGGSVFGRSLAKGGDFHVCVDGNFNHRHLKSSGDCPNFYDPLYVLSKEEVDAVGQHIERVRKAPPNKRSPKVPDIAVDECEDGHTAGNENRTKTNMEKFDDSGLMALVCRHDIPLFLTNIDTPGEQQKYSVALLERLFSLIPSSTTVSVLYDIGCVLDRSLQLYNILPEDVRKRIVFGTSAMHAYVHQWSCQLVYNPRICEGFGLTDGEGVERLWSRLRKLIGITRSSARSKRIWHVDRQVASIGAELRDELGSWIRRRLIKGIRTHQKAAEGVLGECDVPIDVLRAQWDLQRNAQLSLRAHAPARLKKELDTVLHLQGELESVDNAIETAHDSITKSISSSESLEILSGLEKVHDSLKDKVEALYASLNVHESYPELSGIDFQFVRTLLMARDLKINIRKRAIGSFFEWDKLDQAVGGREQTIGTKVHQMTRKAIAKRKPALMNAIRKFNKYCSTLADLHSPDCDIPLPTPLPTQLSALRDGSNLMEDVWITRTVGDVPRWLEDLDVREGIRAMLKVDRCNEERRRLEIEADNLCRWFGRELTAVELALKSSDSGLAILLQQRRTHLLHLQSTWVNPLASTERFNNHVQSANTVVKLLTDDVEGSNPSLVWLLPTSKLALETGCKGEVTELPEAPCRQDHLQEDRFKDGTDETPNETSEVVDVLDQDDIEGLDVDDIAAFQIESVLDVPEDREDLETIKLVWTLPEPCTVDMCLLEDLQVHHFLPIPYTHECRTLHLKSGVRHYFDAPELEIMQSPTARLNDICLNGIAAYLLEYLSSPGHPSFATSNQCALFTTFNLNLVRYESSDSDFWRRTHRTQYWLKRLWILPIHRKRPFEHWVLAFISPYTRQIFLFDSLVGKQYWRHEIKDIMLFASRLLSIGISRGNHTLLSSICIDHWTAQPVLTSPLQTNGYDCGLWILASMAAVFRGFHLTALEEKDMLTFRQLLYHVILYLPVSMN